jgi:hypothetical protein
MSEEMSSKQLDTKADSGGVKDEDGAVSFAASKKINK